VIPVNEPLLDGREKELLVQCIESGWISSEGPFVAEFERRFSQLVSRQHGIAVSNGTAALDVAVEALEIGPGDEIIVPSFTIISCVHQIVRCGAKPIFVDADPQTWNMDVSQVESMITSRTKAIMAVHIYGLPVDLDPLMQIARRHGLKVIEDAAEAIGQTYNGKPCGSFGDVSIFSFYPNKHVTTGEGGMIVTNDDRLAERCKSLRNLCFQPARRFVHEDLGWNYRMTNLQAALGLAQVERLNEAVARKRAMGSLYTSLLQDCPQLQLPLAETAYSKNIYWVYGVVLADEVRMDAAQAMTQLARKGIGTRPFFWPLHLQPVLKKRGLLSGDALPVAERLGNRGFYLPSGLALKADQIEEAARSLREVLNERI
jgi:perosamine synthetase